MDPAKVKVVFGHMALEEVGIGSSTLHWLRLAHPNLQTSHSFLGFLLREISNYSHYSTVTRLFSHPFFGELKNSSFSSFVVMKSFKNACRGTSPDKAIQQNNNVQDISSVCTDSISFVSARSAISEAFCRKDCRKKSYSQVKEEWSLVNLNKVPLEMNLTDLEGNSCIEDIPVDDRLNAHVIRSSCTSISYDEVNQDFFMFSSRCPRPCFCWKRSFFGCSYCASRFCWTWPGWRSQPYGRNVLKAMSKSNSFNPFSSIEANIPSTDPSFHIKNDDNEELLCKNIEKTISPQSNFLKPSSSRGKHRRKRNSKMKRLVMEEAERKEENERWRERGRDKVSANEVATLPVKRPLVQNSRITTRAILEGARHLSSTDGPSLNGILTSRGQGEERNRAQQIDPDDIPPKLVINHLDKASQIPEPLPAPEPDNELKKIDEVDGNPEQENSCLVDCLYVTLQCCDCSIM